MKRIHGLRKLIVWAVMVSAFLLSGCSYSVYSHGDLPFTEVHIGTVENKTLEPKLQDKLHAALTEEFMKNGIMVTPSADTKLSAVIHTFDMTVLSEKEDIAIQYRIEVKTDFTVEDKDGKKDFKKIESPFIVSLSASQNLNKLLATKELAEEEAMRDLAMRMVGALIYK
jgi:hypothetical protein